MRWIITSCLLLGLCACSRGTAPDHVAQRRIPAHRKGVTIVIDAGHGGQDSGTQSLTKPPLYEKHFALNTALRLNEYLQQMGYNTVMTRKRDVFIPLPDRSVLPDIVKADAFVSVHYNAAANRQATGIEVFYFRSKTDQKRREASKSMACHVLEQLISRTSMPNRGVKHGNYHVVRETHVPAILVEGGFMSNNADLKRIKDPRYLDQVARAIAEGLDLHMKHHR